MNWFAEIAERLRDYSDGYIWSTGDEILCKTENTANALADMLWQLYNSQGEDMMIITGFYDPAEERNEERDRFTGWWYVYVE